MKHEPTWWDEHWAEVVYILFWVVLFGYIFLINHPDPTTNQIQQGSCTVAGDC